ncbi:accessory Sec system protein translocase subunit SecY2 [Staphylococcus schleiferi]|nr:accessory Sec system protein translocase subunit SecY2 [Staphylococcus schleiferi]
MRGNMIKRIFKQYEYKILHKRILFAILILLIYILGSHVPIISAHAMKHHGNGFYRLAVSNMGGDISRLNVFSLVLGPWLTAMLIISLWSYKNIEKSMRQTRAEKHFKEKFLTLILSIVQGCFVLNQFVYHSHLKQSNALLLLLILIAGSMMLVWLADQNVRNGVAGPMPIVMLSIVRSIFNQHGPKLNIETYEIIIVTVLIVAALFTLLLIELIEYRTKYQDILDISKENTVNYLAWKLNPGGSLSIMIGLSVFLLLNSTLNLALSLTIGRTAHIKIFSFDNYIGISTYLLIQIVLGYFLSRLMINTKQNSKNFLKSGNYFIGVRPGKETSAYLNRMATRICWFGTFIVGIIIGIPLYCSLFIPHLSQQIYLAVQLIILVYIAINIADTFRTYLYFDKYQHVLKQYW